MNPLKKYRMRGLPRGTYVVRHPLVFTALDVRVGKEAWEQTKARMICNIAATYADAIETIEKEVLRTR